MKFMVLTIALLTVSAHADTAIQEDLNPKPGYAKILIDPPSTSYRTIAVLSDELKFRHSSEEKAIRELAKKAYELGADAVIPADTETQSRGGVALPVGSGFVMASGKRRIVKVRAIKFTEAVK